MLPYRVLFMYSKLRLVSCYRLSQDEGHHWPKCIGTNKNDYCCILGDGVKRNIMNELQTEKYKQNVTQQIRLRIVITFWNTFDKD